MKPVERRAVEDAGAADRAVAGDAGGGRDTEQTDRNQAEVARARLDREQSIPLADAEHWDEYKAQQRRVKVRRRSEQGVKGKTRVAKPHAASGEDEFAMLVKLASKTLVPVEQPVALISQAPRSGGTLLRHLFDGHPKCHVHPYEWHFGEQKTEWPWFDETEKPEELWATLSEGALANRFATGIKADQMKVRSSPPGGSPRRAYPMMLPPLLQRTLFLKLVKPERNRTTRTILNAYLTSLFNAWLNNHSLDDVEKRWVVAFAPRLSWGDGLEGFFSAYPDGALISVLRDPYGWFDSSRRRQSQDVQNDARLLTMWAEGAREMLRSKELYPERVTIISFDDLIRDTAGVMRLLARRLGIAYDDKLTTPTFNLRPIGSNSSYVGTVNVSQAPLTRWKTMLSSDDQQSIAAACSELYERVGELVEHPPRPPLGVRARRSWRTPG